MKIYCIIGRDYDDSFIYDKAFKFLSLAQFEVEKIKIADKKDYPRSNYEYEVVKVNLEDKV